MGIPFGVPSMEGPGVLEFGKSRREPVKVSVPPVSSLRPGRNECLRVLSGTTAGTSRGTGCTRGRVSWDGSPQSLCWWSRGGEPWGQRTVDPPPVSRGDSRLGSQDRRGLSPSPVRPLPGCLQILRGPDGPGPVPTRLGPSDLVSESKSLEVHGVDLLSLLLSWRDS